MRKPSNNDIVQCRSKIAEALFQWEGQPFSLRNYPTHRAFYDGIYPKFLLKAARQVGKSLGAATFICAETVSIPFFKTYYVSPSAEQTRKFSHTRIGKLLAYSPALKKNFIGPESIDNVLLRMLRNGSEMAFTYALDDPDRARGYSADRLVLDECQDILYDAVVPVLEECFDQRVEVLTKVGWKNTSQLTLNDRIADVNDDGYIEWNTPTKIIKKIYSGTMVRFKYKGIDLRVTSDHMMWASIYIAKHQKDKKDIYQFIKASDLLNLPTEGFKLTGIVKQKQVASPKFKLFKGIYSAHGHNCKDRLIPYIPFARLVGWYLAEGSIRWAYRKKKRCHPVRPCITQNIGPGLDDIINTINLCGFSYRVDRGKQRAKARFVTINSRQLGEYFLALGKAADKYIPEEFFAFPELLMQVLKGLYLGDATKRKAPATWETWELFTISRRLADDVHRAWTLLGRSPRIRSMQLQSGKIGYKICAYVPNPYFFYTRQNRVTAENVTNEPVYCFTVKNHRPIIRGDSNQRPVITSQCMANSRYAYSMYTGTPKTTENTIEQLWQISSQTEWVIKCSGCSKYTLIINDKCIGKKGPECLNCRKLLNPRNGKWVDMVSGYGKRDDDDVLGGPPIKAFHISQPLLPENVPCSWTEGTEEHERAERRWDRLLYKHANYGEVEFANEVLGVSTSTGARLFTKELLESLCNENYDLLRSPPPKALDLVKIIAGVDWSGGGTPIKAGADSLVKSRTVLHIWGQTPDGRLRTLFYKIFPLGHCTGWIDEIVEVCQNWSVQMLCGDAGEGQMANALLRERLGGHRVVQIRYMAMSKPMNWNPETLAYHVDRTTIIDNFAMFVKRNQVIYTKLTQMEPAFKDILNVYEETTTMGRKVWRHAASLPDDCLHAQIFGWLAYKILAGDVKFY